MKLVPLAILFAEATYRPLLSALALACVTHANSHDIAMASTNLRGGGRTGKTTGDVAKDREDSRLVEAGDDLENQDVLHPSYNDAIRISTRRQTQEKSLLPIWQSCSSSEQCSTGCCASQFSTDGKLKCSPLEGAFRPDVCVIHTNPSVRSSVTTLSTGTCGGGSRGNGICADGNCCSEYGWCGVTPEHCAGGGGVTVGTPPPSSKGTCGGGSRGNGICADGNCCSQFGWCGVTPEHCSTTGGSSGGGSTGNNTGSTSPPSTGTCGGGNRGNGICADGNCCSPYGWCGVTPKHCSTTGGESGGSTGNSTGSTPPPSTGTCGRGSRGNGICADRNCCSPFGWCGVTPEHCGSTGSGSDGASTGNNTGTPPPSTGSTPPPTIGTCGGGSRGNGICADGTCCSPFGWCGITPEHCGSTGGGSGENTGATTPPTGAWTVTSPAITLTAEQIQVGINAKGDGVSVSQVIVDSINEVTKGYSLYRQLAFVTHTIWESGSYQYREELDTSKYGNYQDCDWNQDGVQLPDNDKLYYGRGYIQLSWCANYKAYGANRMYQGDADLFYNQPELVATDDFIAMDSAAWFFETIVTDTTGQFGLTTKAINGQQECSGGSSEKAKMRYEIFVALANAVGLSGYSESGCYN